MSPSLRERTIDITRHLNTFDIEAIRGLLSDSPYFHFRFGPESAVQALGNPGGFNKEEVLDFFSNHRRIVKYFNVSVELRCRPIHRSTLMLTKILVFGARLCSRGREERSVPHQI
jgi:hypothetical protein